MYRSKYEQKGLSTNEVTIQCRSLGILWIGLDVSYTTCRSMAYGLVRWVEILDRRSAIPIRGNVGPNSSYKVRAMPDFWVLPTYDLGASGVNFTNVSYR